MGKSRKGGKANNKKPAVERIRKPNPFDLVFKKSKSQVNGNSKPFAAAKRQSFDVRQRTIGVEYANQGKTNRIVDKRIYERDAGISATEKAEKRFILQRKQLFSKGKSRFNLEDDDEENNGENGDDNEEDGFFPVAKGEKFNTRKRVDRDDVDGELDSELVALANFGGGKFEDEKRAENLASGPAKREEIIANLISASKQAKALRQMERDAQADNTDRLNSLFDRLKNAGALHLATTVQRGALTAAPARPEANEALDSAATPQPLSNDDANHAPPTESISEPQSAVSEPQPDKDDANKNETTQSYDRLYRELLYDDSGKKAVATNTKKLTDIGPPAELDELIAELENVSQTCSAENLERIASITQKLQNHVKVRPFLCAERVLALVESHRESRAEAVKADPEFGGVAFASVALVRAVGQIFSIAERFNIVAPPTLIFATEWLAKSRVRGAQHASQLIFLCDVLGDWITESKRYIPEVIAFLRGCLLLCVNNADDENFPSLSFPISAPFRRMFYLESKSTAEPEDIPVVTVFTPASEPEQPAQTPQASSADLPAKRSPSKRTRRKSAKGDSASETTTTTPKTSWSWSGDEAKLATIRKLFAVTRRFAEFYATHTISSYAIFKPFLGLLKRLPTENFPPRLAADVQQLVDFMQEKLDTAPQLTQLKLPIKNMIRPVEMLEPRFDDNFDPAKTKYDNVGDAGGNAARKARKRELVMRQRLRKETRGAMKELRMDAKFIAKLQSENAQKVSKERREKTKRILAGLQTQESEYKKRKLKKY